MKTNFNYVTPNVMSGIDELDKEKIQRFNDLYAKFKKKEKTFYRYKEKIKIEKNELDNIKQELKLLDQDLGHIKNTYYFKCSLVSYKTRGIEYFNLSILRYKQPPKNCSLGRAAVIKEHLLKFYKTNKKLTSRIQKDWMKFVKVDSNFGDTFHRISDLILENPLNFKNITINRHVLFPLEPFESKVSIPLMMTNKMRMNLRMMGYTDEELKHMRPEEGWEIIKKDNLE